MRYRLAQVARRYDLVVLVAPPAHVRRGAASILPTPDVIHCATVGATSLDDLGASVTALRGAGARVRGAVLWNAGPPVIDATSAFDIEQDPRATLPISVGRSGG
jgi:hypothetical protein